VPSHADETTSRWYQRVVPVCALVVALGAALALVSPGFREQVALSATHQPQEYVALSFGRTAEGTVALCTSSRDRVGVRFVVESHLRQPRELAYAIVVGDARRTGAVAVEPGETTEVSRRLPRPARGPFTIVVRLPDVGERVVAHCPGARP